MDLAQTLREAGVVGAGGAGFPAHVKAASKAEVVIANGAECEPLLQKDQAVLRHFTDEVLDGLELLRKACGAARGVLAVKAKHKELIAHLEGPVRARGLELFKLGDFYPSGDEYCLVFDVTGRLIPPAGIPIQVGVVVQNVETLYNAARASREPVTDTFVTVVGAVRNPRTLRLPVGTSMEEALALAGGAKVPDYAVLDGGAMMGKVVSDLSRPLTKTSSGFILLPKGHALLGRKGASREVDDRVGKSACDQCSLCTELCPRYLLGYSIQPHRVMRSLLFSPADRRTHSEWALLCCECQLCTLYACPENLAPGKICVSAKSDLTAEKVSWKNAGINPAASGAQAPAPKTHSMRPFRKVPVSQLIARLGLSDYDAQAPFVPGDYAPKRVRIPLKQHAGAPASCVVREGQAVRRGELIADIPAGQLGARVHASISGRVSAISDLVEITA